MASRPDGADSSKELDPGERRVLFVGDLDDRHGPDLIVRAMPEILRRHPGVRLMLVGAGPLEAPLRALARYLQIEEATRFLGCPGAEELAALLATCEVVVVPAREAVSWQPVQAAWAAGKPVVMTHNAAAALEEHDRMAVRVYPSENSVAAGVERVLGKRT